MTKLMFRIAALAAFPLCFAAPLTIGACDSDEDSCASDDCDSDRVPIFDEDDDGDGTTRPPQPVPCRQACASLIGDCDATDPSFKITQTDCIEWCERGGLTGGEAFCLADVQCGGAVDQCFDPAE